MSKFKIGDRVRVVKSCDNYKMREVGLEFTISMAEGDFDGKPSWSDYGNGGERKSGWRWKESELELVSGLSPIREVTRKEIKPRVYGIVMVKNGQNGRFVDVWLNGSEASGLAHWYSADELRAAARVFNELAEYLEEKNND